MVQVYTEPLCRRHYGGVLGDAFLFRLGLFIIAVAVSIVVAFTSGGFWVKIKPALDQPTVHYSNDALVIFEGQMAGQERVWSSSAAVVQEFEAVTVPANVKSGEEDFNADGKPDVIEFSISVQSETPVYGVKALIQLKYSYESNIKLQMYTLAYLAFNSPTPGGTLHADGELVLQQKTPITDRRYNGLYDFRILDSNASSAADAIQGAPTLELQDILKSYLDRNYTTAFVNHFPVWKASVGNDFTLNMRIRIPPNQVIWYRPQVIEMLKFGWIQFLATYICLWWLFWYFQYFAFTNRILTTRVASDLTSKTQRF